MNILHMSLEIYACHVCRVAVLPPSADHCLVHLVLDVNELFGSGLIHGGRS